MTHEAVIGVTGIGFTDYCEGMIASGFDVNAKKVNNYSIKTITLFVYIYVTNSYHHTDKSQQFSHIRFCFAFLRMWKQATFLVTFNLYHTPQPQDYLILTRSILLESYFM